VNLNPSSGAEPTAAIVTTSNDVAVMDAMDAQTKPSKEECALGTGQNSNYATVKDAPAPTILRRRSLY